MYRLAQCHGNLYGAGFSLSIRMEAVGSRGDTFDEGECGIGALHLGDQREKKRSTGSGNEDGEHRNEQAKGTDNAEASAGPPPSASI